MLPERLDVKAICGSPAEIEVGIALGVGRMVAVACGGDWVLACVGTSMLKGVGGIAVALARTTVL